MANITTTTTTIVVNTKEGMSRFKFNNGKIEIHTNVDKNAKSVYSLGGKIKKYLLNFEDKKRDYAHRIKKCAAELQKAIGGGSTIAHMEKMFA